jgi:hypothetical protein
MRAALLPSDYYGGSATPGRHQPTADLPAAVLAARREGRHPGASHVHHVPVGRGVPSFSPAASPRVRRRPSPWPPRAQRAVTSGVAAHRRPPVSACAADRPPSARFEPDRRLRGSTTGSLVVAPSCLACRTRPVWQSRTVPSLSGLLPPSLAPPRPGCPSFNRAAATAQRWVLSPHPVTWRLVAHCLVGVQLGPGAAAANPTLVACLQRLARSGDTHRRCLCSSLGCSASALSPESASLCRWSFSRSFHQALLHPTRPYSPESPPN